MILPELKREQFETSRDLALKLKNQLKLQFNAIQKGNNLYFDYKDRKLCVNLPTFKLIDLNSKLNLNWDYLGNEYLYFLYHQPAALDESLEITLQDEAYINRFFSLNVEKKIEVEKVISFKEIDQIFNKEYPNIIISAPPGTRKTYTMLEYLVDRKIKSIIIMPYVLLVKEVVEKLGEKIIPIFAGTTKDEIRNILDQNRPVVTTYEKFISFQEILEKDNYRWQYTLVIDEYHKLVTDSNKDFKWKAVKEIKKVMYEYGCIVGLSGTIWGTVVDSQNFKIFEIIPSSTENITQIKICVTDDDINLIINSLLEAFTNTSNSNNKVCVFWNNKLRLRQIGILAEKKGVPKEKIMLLLSDTKYSLESQDLFKHSRFSEEKKIILATSVISSGINIIDEEIDCIYIVNEPNIIEVVQFLHRFRKKELVKEIIEFIPGRVFAENVDPDKIELYYDSSETDSDRERDDYYSLRVTDLKTVLDKDLYELKKLAESLNSFIFKFASDGKIVKELVTFVEKSKLFYEHRNEIVLYLEPFYRRILMMLFKDSFDDTRLRRLLYNYYHIDSISDWKITSNTKKIITDEEIRDTLKSAVLESKKEFLELLESYPLDTIYFFLERKPKLEIEIPSTLEGKLSNFIPSEHFTNSGGKMFVDSKKYDYLIEHYIFYAESVKLSKKFTLQILNNTKAKIEQFRYAILYLKYIKTKDSFSSEAAFVHKLDKYLIDNKNFITTEGLDTFFDSYDSSKGLIKHFSKNSIDRLEKIYKLDRISSKSKGGYRKMKCFYGSAKELVENFEYGGDSGLTDRNVRCLSKFIRSR